jgi:hypothetical protein
MPSRTVWPPRSKRKVRPVRVAAVAGESTDVGRAADREEERGGMAELRVRKRDKDGDDEGARAR